MSLKAVVRPTPHSLSIFDTASAARAQYGLEVAGFTGLFVRTGPGDGIQVLMQRVNMWRNRAEN